MSNVRIRFKGYAPERMKSGEIRHRVRVKGNAKKRMVIPVGPINGVQELLEVSRDATTQEACSSGQPSYNCVQV